MRSQIRFSMHSWLDHPQHVWVQNRAHLHNAARWRQGFTLFYVLPFCKLIFFFVARYSFSGEKNIFLAMSSLFELLKLRFFWLVQFFFFNTLTKRRYLVSHFCRRENRNRNIIIFYTSLLTNRDMKTLIKSINSFIPVKGESVCHLSFDTIWFIKDWDLFDWKEYI